MTDEPAVPHRDRSTRLVTAAATLGATITNETADQLLAYLDAMLSPSQALNPSYGYLWWLMDNNAYRAIGIFGQGICVHPEQQVVVALHSARPVASKDEDWALQAALCEGLAAALE